MSQDAETMYADMIHLPHPVSKRHPQMSMADRAAQFSPFAALNGHDAAIAEAAIAVVTATDTAVAIVRKSVL